MDGMFTIPKWVVYSYFNRITPSYAHFHRENDGKMMIKPH